MGRTIPKFNLQETTLHCRKDSPAPYWQEAIVSVDATPIYTDGSKSEQGIVGGGYWFSQGKLGIRVGDRATVWDGEIAGLERGIQAARNRDWKVLLLTDSKAAIQATQKAGRTGRARTRALAALGSEIYTRTQQYGTDNVRMAWVKAHIGIPGNEEADAMAKSGTEKDTGGEITEGGLKQRNREVRKGNRVQAGYRCVTEWDRRTATTYTHLRTNRGNLLSWRKK